MKSKRLFVYSVLAVALATLGLRAAWAQDIYTSPDRADVFAPPPSSGVDVRIDPGEIRNQVDRSLAVAGIRFGDSPEGGVRKAAEKLRDAPNDAAKVEAQTKLIELLRQCFDEDMARREKEIAKLQARIDKLSAQLERRRAAKQEIVDLQFKVVMNEVNGLGFTTRSADPFVGDWDAYSNGRQVLFTGNNVKVTTVPLPNIAPTPPLPAVAPTSEPVPGVESYGSESSPWPN